MKEKESEIREFLLNNPEAQVREDAYRLFSSLRDLELLGADIKVDLKVVRAKIKGLYKLSKTQQ